MKNLVTLCFAFSFVFVLNAQDVGIGLTNPLYRLHIQENDSYGPQLMVENTGLLGFTSIDINHGDGDALLRFRDDNILKGGLYWDKANDNVSLFIYGFPVSKNITLNHSTGDVGIGTVDAFDKLHLHKSSSSTVGLRLSNLTTGLSGGFRMYVTGSGASYISAPDGGALFLTADPGTPGGRVHLYTNGNVGINTGASANYDLEVEGDFATRGGDALIDGNLGVGTMSPSAKAHIIGNAFGPQLLVSRVGGLGYTSIDLDNGGSGNAQLRFRNGGTFYGGLYWNVYGNLSLYSNSNPNYYNISLDQGTGYVGVGTEAATTKLHVYKNALANTYFRLSNSATGLNDGLDYYINGAGTGYIQSASGKSLFVSSSNGSGGAVKFYSNGNVGVNTSATASYDLEVEGDLATKGGNALVDGYLGVGTKTPTARTHILGTTSGPQLLIDRSGGSFTSADLDNNGSGDALLRFRNGNAIYGGLSWDASDTDVKMFIYNHANDRCIALDQSTGYVGIGLNNATAKLHVHKPLATTTRLRISNTNTGNDGLDLEVSGTGVGYIRSASAKALFLSSSNGTGGGVHLYTNGNVGVNTGASANFDLEVEGDLATRAGDAFVDGQFFVGTTSPSSYQAQIVQNGTYGLDLKRGSTGNNWEFRMSAATTNASMYLYYNGSYRGYFSASTGAYTPTSDRRLKTGFVSVTNVLGNVLKLQPMSYYFNTDPEKAQRSIGFVAQDVKPLFPELVTVTNDGPKEGIHHLDYNGFGVLAIAAIQEQQQQIDNLKSENAELKARLEKIEEALNHLTN